MMPGEEMRRSSRDEKIIERISKQSKWTMIVNPRLARYVNKNDIS